MKRLSIVCMVLLVSVFMATSAFPIEYCLDFLEAGNPGGRTTGLKTCDATNPEAVSVGGNFSIDIWELQVPESLISGGYQMTFDPNKVSIVSVQAYDGVDIAGGPWDGTGTFKIPDTPGPGSYILGLVQLSCAVPDAGGGIILAKVTFESLATGSTDISIRPIDGFDTNVGCNSGINYDLQMGTENITITPAGGCTDPCSDNNACTTNDACVGDTCVGSPIVCSDGNVCTDDSCDTGSGCQFTNNTAPCNDNNACTGNDTCSGGSCTGTPVVCDDGQFCNGTEVCDPVNGCQAGTPVNCPDDNLFCNGTESCNEASDSCVSSGNPCTEGTVCNENTNTCDVVGCQVNADCDDGQFCNGAETCVAGNCQAGTPPDCNDNVNCTIDSCNEAQDSCDHAPNNAVCDDGQFCNGSETCDTVNGCQAGTAVICTDDGLFCSGTESCNEDADSCASSGNPCTTGTVCNEDTDTCDVVGCEINADCDDGQYCNGAETCAAGNCQAGTPPECNDSVDCTIDSCNEAQDSCDHAPDNAVCDDGEFCNGSESCDPVNGCQDGTAVTCTDDGLFCTGTESCNEAADSCASSGNPCAPGTACNEDTDSCEPVGECATDADCADGSYCNGAEVCVAGACQAGVAVNCNDGVDCTDDSCNEDTDSCLNTPNNANCLDDGQFCNGTEFCDPVKGCSSTGNPCSAGTVCNEQTDSCDQPAISVKVDIKPGSCPNPLNLKSKGVLSVAVLGSKNLRVWAIDPMSITIGREGVAGGVAPIRFSYEDVARPYYGELCGCDRCKCSSDSCADDEDEGDGSCKCRDGYRDLVLKFETEELVETLMLKNVAGQTIPLIVTGNLREEKGGAPFSGEDCVKILKKKEKPDEDEHGKPEKDKQQKSKNNK